MSRQKLKFALLIGLVMFNLSGAGAQSEKDSQYGAQKPVDPPSNSEQPDFDKEGNATDKEVKEYLKSHPDEAKALKGLEFAFGGTPLRREFDKQVDSEEKLAYTAYQKRDYREAITHYMHSIAYSEAKCKIGALTESKPATRSVNSVDDCLDCLQSMIHMTGMDVTIPNVVKSNGAVTDAAEKLFYLGICEDNLGNCSQADRLYTNVFPYIIIGTYRGIPPGPLGGKEIENQLKLSLAQAGSKCGLKSPSLALRAELLADFYCHGGNYSESEELYNQAITIRKEVKQADNPYFLSHDLSNLGMCLSRQHKDANSVYSRLPLVQERAYGKDSLAAAHAWYGAGISSMAKHDYKTAESQLRQGISIFEKLDIKTWPRKNIDLPGYKGQLNTCMWMLKKEQPQNQNFYSRQPLGKYIDNKTSVEKGPALYATKNIGEGEIITADKLEVRNIAKTRIPQNAITSIDAAAGRICRRRILAGERIVRYHLTESSLAR